MFGRKCIFYDFASCLLIGMVAVCVDTARRQLGFCETEHTVEELWAFSLASWKLVLALTFNLSGLHDILGVPARHTSSAAMGAGTSSGAVAGKLAVGTEFRPGKALPMGLEMLSKPESRPKGGWPIGPTY